MRLKLPAFFIFIILILSFTQITKVYSQNYNIDSIAKALKKTPEKDKISQYYILTDYYIYNSPPKAIKYANEFLILAEKLDSTYIINYCYQILGEAYYFQDNYEKSLEYFTKYLNNQLTPNNEHNLGSAYNSLGIVYRAMENYPKAIECYEKSKNIYLEIEDIDGLSSTYNNLGVLHESLNLYSKARGYYHLSEEIELQLDNPEGISTSFLNLGGIYHKMGIYDTAIDYCKKSIDLCVKHHFNHSLELNYDILYQIYKEKNQIGLALDYLEKFYELKNQRVNEETNSQIAELEIKYQADKKQEEIEDLNAQKEQRKIINLIYLIALTVFAIQAVILLILNKKRRKNNSKLRIINTETIQQKEEIEAQRDEIEAQRDEIKRQKDIADFQTGQILKQNKDITDSIEYAKHIQIALFPNKLMLQKILKQGFCLFKPKDIVSGDFYWVAQENNKSIIAAADCTGHGVPGAFMSIIGINFLNDIVINQQILKPSEILNQLRKNIIKTMVHANKIDESKDGMDISLIVIDYENMILEYAGAYNHLYYIRDHMLETIKADRMPIGISEKSIQHFTNHEIKIQSGDQFYMFTDGYADQFGGPLRKKFRVGSLRELLLDIHEKEMHEQKRILHETFINWRGKQPQVDDVLSIGIKI